MVGEDRLVVVGNGMVGWQFCQQLIAHGQHRERRIVVYGEEPRPAYDRIRLSACLNGTLPEQLSLGTESWYAEHGIELVLGTRVTAIDRTCNCIETTNGVRNYAHLVLATGSRPFVPPIPGMDLPGVMTYRTIDDVLRIREAAKPGSRVIILGGGLLGLELAKELVDHGVEVVILERSPGLMIRQLNPVASGMLREQIERLGIEVMIDISVESITRTFGSLAVNCMGGLQQIADVVIVAAGIRPRDELAKSSGLTCSPSGGIIVDRFLRTSVPHISAIGECVSFGSTVYGLAAPGYHMAEILARRFAGDLHAEFAGYDLGTRLKLAGLDVLTMGDYLADGKTATWRSGRDYRQVVLRDGKLVGATIIGGYAEQAYLSDAVARRLTIDDKRLQHFSKVGELFNNGIGVIGWPGRAIVCSCMLVSRATLGQALTSGCTTIEQLSTTTRAGTVCGSCRPLLAQLVGADPQDQPAPKGIKIVFASSVAVLLLVLISVVWEVPRATSFLELSSWELWWRDGVMKQITGWSMVAIMVISCVYSLRKRVRWLRWGDIGRWRAVHAVITLVAGCGLLVHSGFRFGHNLNWYLASTFSVVLVLGGIAGLIISSERTTDTPFIRHARVWSLQIHIAAVLLLLPLIVFHVIKVYQW